MIDPAIIASVYDFAFLFENALKTILTDSGMRGYTSRIVPHGATPEEDAELVADGYELLDFQKDRPRAEINFIPGAGAGIFNQITIAGQLMEVETSWAGQYQLRAITRSDIQIHAAYVCQIRFILQTLRLRITEAALPNHIIQAFAKDAGTGQTFEPEKGTLQTTLTLDINFSVLAQALATLNT